MPEIRVMSRAELSGETFDHPVAVISVKNPGGAVPEIQDGPNVRGVLRLEFEDVEDPGAGVAMSDEQAARILQFVRSHADAGAQIVCQCEAGVSRSAGMAAALSRILFGHDGSFHRTHRPNAWVRRKLLLAAEEAYWEDALDDTGLEEAGLETGVRFLPTALPNTVLKREGIAWQWVPRTEHTYPTGTLGGGDRTLTAHLFLPLQGRKGKYWGARAISTWARKALRETEATKDAVVITRAGAWRERVPDGAHGRNEPAVEIYVQVSGARTRDVWGREIAGFSDTIGRRFQQERFDVVLAEDGLMFKRAVWHAPTE